MVKLRSYLEQIAKSLSPYLARQRITLEIEGPDVELEVSAGPFSQVVTNLLQNTALHAYQGQGGTVTVSIHSVTENDVSISIIDTGVGIDTQSITRIFEPLFTTKRGEGGSGLGLHICYTTVRDILKGTIDVESELGKGTRFKVRLPRKLAKAKGSVSEA